MTWRWSSRSRAATATAAPSRRWVVGATRQQLRAAASQPTITDLGFFFDWLIVDVVPRERRVWEPLNWQLCDPARRTTIVSGGRGDRAGSSCVFRARARTT